MIGQADFDDVKDLLPPRPDALDVVPYGPGDVEPPEFDALSFDEPKCVWFQYWMGVKRTVHSFGLQSRQVPERYVLAWLGFLRSELEGDDISPADYDTLRALLPPVNDDLTPLLVATA